MLSTGSKPSRLTGSWSWGASCSLTLAKRRGSEKAMLTPPSKSSSSFQYLGGQSEGSPTLKFLYWWLLTPLTTRLPVMPARCGNPKGDKSIHRLGTGGGGGGVTVSGTTGLVPSLHERVHVCEGWGLHLAQDLWAGMAGFTGGTGKAEVVVEAALETSGTMLSHSESEHYTSLR